MNRTTTMIGNHDGTIYASPSTARRAAAARAANNARATKRPRLSPKNRITSRYGKEYTRPKTTGGVARKVRNFRANYNPVPSSAQKRVTAMRSKQKMLRNIREKNASIIKLKREVESAKNKLAPLKSQREALKYRNVYKGLPQKKIRNNIKVLNRRIIPQQNKLNNLKYNLNKLSQWKLNRPLARLTNKAMSIARTVTGKKRKRYNN